MSWASLSPLVLAEAVCVQYSQPFVADTAT